MNAPNTAYDGAAAYKVCPSPCTPECTGRTATCKFDGTCDKYDKWKAEYEKTRAEVRQRYSGARGAASMVAVKRDCRKYQASTEWNKKFQKMRG